MLLILGVVKGYVAQGTKSDITSKPPSGDDNLWVDFLLNELFGDTEEFSSENNNRRGTVSDFLILNLGDVDENLCCWVADVKRPENRCTIIRYSDVLLYRASHAQGCKDLVLQDVSISITSRSFIPFPWVP